MTRIEAALLFTTQPILAFEHFVETLNSRLTGLEVQFTRASTDRAGQLALTAPGMQLTVTARNCPLPAASFHRALEGLISERSRGPISDVLRRHARYMLVALTPVQDGSAAEDSPQQRLRQMRVAHAAATLVAELHQPAAVHWRQSRQLLLGAQFLGFAGEDTPWALLARADICSPEYLHPAGSSTVLRIQETGGLLDRPIEALLDAHPEGPEHAYASALAFLRHAVGSGQVLSDGDRFGPDEAHCVTVSHIAGTDADPAGLYRLSATPVGQVNSPPNASGAGLLAAISKARSHGQERPAGGPKAAVLHALALVAMPPLGLALVVSNAVLGASYLRTGLLTLGAVALALGVATWSVVGGRTQLDVELVPTVSVLPLPAD